VALTRKQFNYLTH